MTCESREFSSATRQFTSHCRAEMKSAVSRASKNSGGISSSIGTGLPSPIQTKTSPLYSAAG